MKANKYTVTLAAIMLIASTVVGNKNKKSKSVYVYSSDKIELQGIVKTENAFLENATVILYLDNEEIYTMQTSEKGEYQLLLTFNKEYIVEIRKEEYVAKRFTISTKAPSNKKIKLNRPFQFGVNLLKQDIFQGINISILNFPVTQFYYDKKTKQFEYDKEYAKNMKEVYKEMLERARQKKERNPVTVSLSI